MSPEWTAGELYEPWIGRWSRLVARDFVPWLGVRRDAGWLDVGCGTGALVQAILDLAWPGAVTGVDSSEAYVAYARQHIRGVTFEIGSATELPVPDRSFDAVVSGLVINFVPDPARMLGEMLRVARAGAAVGLYVWDYSGGMQMIRRFWDTAVELDPAARDLDQGADPTTAGPDWLAGLARETGLHDVQSRGIEVPTVFRDFADFWSPFLSGQGAAPGYVASLGEEQRSALRDALSAQLTRQGDDSIRLVARAWAVRCRA